ncbi:uncharacterized protein LOC144663891 [Oculina patagonica]
MMEVMLLAKILVWSFLLVAMTVNGDDTVRSNSLETKLFSASIVCKPSYQTTEDVKCDFHLKNIGDRAYSVLTWNTPLNKLGPKGLVVTRDGKKLEFEGIMMKREDPGRRNFVTIAAGETLSSKFDLSSGYNMVKPGTYTVAVDDYLEYTEGRASNIHVNANTGIQEKLAHLSSPAVSFQVVGPVPVPKRALGE